MGLPTRVGIPAGGAGSQCRADSDGDLWDQVPTLGKWGTEGEDERDLVPTKGVRCDTRGFYQWAQRLDLAGRDQDFVGQFFRDPDSMVSHFLETHSDFSNNS